MLISKKLEILTKYFDFFDVFSSDFIVKIQKYISINNWSINLLNNSYFFYNLIYTLELVKLKILKAYIKANLASSFIRLFKFIINTSILFIKRKIVSFICI